MVTANYNKAGDLVGIAGEHNILSAGQGYGGKQGVNSVILIWGSTYDVDGNYVGDEPTQLSKSDPMNVTLTGSECDTKDVQVEETVDW